MDILLIYPPLSVKERYGNRRIGQSGGHLPPLGIAGIAAYLKERGYAVGLVDALALDMTDEDICRYISSHKPKIVGLSALTSMFHRALALASVIRQQFPETLTVIGGQHATIMGEKVFRETTCFDILVSGEGELTTLELMEIYKNTNYDREKLLHSLLLKHIKGVIFKKDNSIVRTQPRKPIADIDSLPFPARDLLPMDRYIPLPNQYKRLPVVHMVSTRGCPYPCSFCSASAVFGKKVRQKSPERVISEIKHVMERYKAREISFWDDTMTINKNWIMEFCDRIISEKIDITWTCYGHVNTVTKEVLLKMKKAGCFNIFYGYEAGDQMLLDLISKGTTLDKIRQVNQWTKEAGIEIRASFMLGLPGETPELARKTMGFAIELEPDYAQFSLTTPYPGTTLWQQAKVYGNLKTDFSEYHGWSAVFLPHGYKNREELSSMEKEAMRRFYFRPRYILNQLKKIKNIVDLIRYVKGFRFALGFLR
ncbi:MAG: cobalamin B12-binding domain-containing protein [Deltaproteobacteria bacterium]|nr:cobalamin B12-binding domain-containing protein [Deltaproteobacteria bacterium]